MVFTLTTQQRTSIILQLATQFYNNPSNPITPNKVAPIDLVAIGAAVDNSLTWINSNVASYLAALPTTFANNSTQAEKLALFKSIIDKLSGFG